MAVRPRKKNSSPRRKAPPKKRPQRVVSLPSWQSDHSSVAPGYELRFYDRRGRLASRSSQVASFRVYDRESGKPLQKAEKIAKKDADLLGSAIAWGESRARHIAKSHRQKRERRIYEKLARLQLKIYANLDQLEKKNLSQKRRQVLAKTRKKLISRLSKEMRETLEGSRIRGRSTRSEDKVSYKEGKRISIIKQSIRFIPMELSRDKEQAELLLSLLLDEMAKEIWKKVRRDPKRINTIEYGLLALIDDDERLFPDTRLYLSGDEKDEKDIRRSIEGYKDKMLSDFFIEAPTSHISRRQSATSYFQGKYKDALVEVSGFAVDIVDKPQKAPERLTALEKEAVSLGYHRSASIRREIERRKQLRQKKTTKKQKEKRKSDAKRRKKKKGRVIPGKLTSRIKVERNPRKG